MQLRRREMIVSGGALWLAQTLPRRAFALDYPNRTARIVVGYPAGITPDIVTRLVAQSLSQQLGQQFIVDNRPGAASNIATEMVAHASTDGYTLLTMTATNVINVTLYPNLNFDLHRDIAPVAGLLRSASVLVITPSLAAKTLAEFIAYAKANPGKLNYASAGSGSAANVAGELFKAMAGVDLVHVPYRGNYLPDLMSGQVQVGFSPIAQVIAFIRTGKLRALGVTGATSSEILPDVPAIAQAVPGYEAYVWDGLGAPTGTPAEIIDKLNHEVGIALSDPTMKARFVDLGAETMVMTPDQFGRFVESETIKWAKVIKTAGITAAE